MEGDDTADDVESGTPQMSFRKVREILPEGGFGTFLNTGPRVNDEPNNVRNLEMYPNGSYLKCRKVR